MYNKDIICTYNTSEIFQEKDNISDEEKYLVRDIIYRQELLDVFAMAEFNEIEMSENIHEIYEKIKDCKELKECMLKLSERFMSIDEELGLMIMFSYDYMYITHICICEYLQFGKITEINLLNLKSLIF